MGGELGECLYRALRVCSPDYIVHGDPASDPDTIIDGHFNLQRVAETFLSYVEATGGELPAIVYVTKQKRVAR